VNNTDKELSIEHLGITALNPFSQHTSSSRLAMFAGHVSQRLVIDKPEEKRIQTGLEKEMSKYTFNIKMPNNGRIIDFIHRYPPGVGKESLNFNPETIVIYEIEETKEIDCFTIPYHASYHQVFGFKYEPKDSISKIKPGAFIPKDTIFADSNSVSENGGWMFGTNLNVAFMTVPSVAEDGFMISEDVLDKFKFRIYETRVVEFGSSNFPLNIYGSRDHYKPFPDIGEYISDTRNDGILMMLRDYDETLSPVDMSIYDTMEPDFLFDKAVYVRGGNGRIVDIKVVSNNKPIRNLPEEIIEHIEKYRKAYDKFNHELIRIEQRLRAERKKKYGVDKLNMTPKLHNLIVSALAAVNYDSHKSKYPLNVLYRQAPIDEYMIEFTIEYEITPDIGYKLTDMQGGFFG